MRIYLDNNATTAMHPDVLAVLNATSRDVFGNPSSIHSEGQRARQVLEEARETVARLIGAASRDILFTSGGTESNNAALLGVHSMEGRFHIVTTAIEHPSVAAAVAELERRGCGVTRVAPRRSGEVPAEDVSRAITPETRLVAVMLANNETGVIQPVEAVGAICRERKIHFHCDAVQAAGKIAVSVEAIGCDTLSLSAHKMHGPKGIGALYVRGGTVLAPLLRGGAQERRRRAGTESVPLAAAFATAAALPPATAEMARLRDRFEQLISVSDDVVINGRDARRLPNTSNLTFREADGEGIVIALDLEGVAVSTGSACSSGRIEPSATLLASGLSDAEARATVRISLSRMTSEEEVERAARLVREIVPRCRSRATAAGNRTG
jgi:cysteine desulfurase